MCQDVSKDVMGVTIVIPYYKRPITINQTLSSLTLVDYDLSKLEVVIVDDGSPLEHRPNLDHYRKHFSVQYLWQEDQ